MLMTRLLAGGLVGGAMHGEDRQLQLLSPLAQLPECLQKPEHAHCKVSLLSGFSLSACLTVQLACVGVCLVQG